MPKPRFALFLAATSVFSLVACSRTGSAPISQGELVRRTQELMDSIVPGDQTAASKYYAEDMLYFDEKGRAMNKKAMLADLSPMPSGYSGSIKVVNVHSSIDRDVAILSYDMDETETIFGQLLHARYHETDTWRQRNGEWQIVAGQVLRYYEDPAVGTADARKFADYVGTYELAAGNRRAVVVDSGKLYSQRGERKEELLPESGDIFFRRGVEGRILFGYNKQGKVETLIDRRNNEDVIWKKVE